MPCRKCVGSQKEEGRLLHPWIIIYSLARAHFQSRLMDHPRNPKVTLWKVGRFANIFKKHTEQFVKLCVPQYLLSVPEFWETAANGTMLSSWKTQSFFSFYYIVFLESSWDYCSPISAVLGQLASSRCADPWQCWLPSCSKVTHTFWEVLHSNQGKQNSGR